jgi:hypothetical protein
VNGRPPAAVGLISCLARSAGFNLTAYIAQELMQRTDGHPVILLIDLLALDYGETQKA